VKLLEASEIRKFREEVREMLDITEEEEEELRKEGIEIVIPSPYLRRMDDSMTERLEKARNAVHKDSQRKNIERRMDRDRR
jgi:hypothetical protein